MPPKTDGDLLDYPFGARVPRSGEAIDVAPGIRWARMPLGAPLDHINVWIVADGDGFALVDTGFASGGAMPEWEALLAGPLGGQRITRLIITHHHADHCGLAGWLCERLAIPLSMPAEEWRQAQRKSRSGIIPTEAHLRIWIEGGCLPSVLEEMAAGWADVTRDNHPMPDDYSVLRDGDRPDICGGRFEVVFGSGHCVEHACLHDPAAGVLIAGDQVLPEIRAGLVIEPDGCLDPVGRWLTSLHQLFRLSPDLLVLPSHGRPFYGLHPRLRTMIAQCEDRLDRLVAQLAEPHAAYDCLTTTYSRPLPANLLGIGVAETMAYLIHLEQMRRVTRSIKNGRVLFQRCGAFA